MDIKKDFEKIILSSSFPSSSTFSKPSRPKSKPFIIGVSGGTASGKTTVCRIIHKSFERNNAAKIAIISQDSFYNPLTPEQKAKAMNGDFNFDHPDAFDWQLLHQVFHDLSLRKPVQIPEYDFITHSRTSTTRTIYGADIILFEGILAFYNVEVRNLMDMKLFVDTDADTRLARRVLRDIQTRGRDLDNVLFQYQKFVKPAFDEFIFPTKRYADLIIPRGSENTVAIELICQHIQSKLDDKETILRNRLPMGEMEL